MDCNNFCLRGKQGLTHESSYLGTSPGKAKREVLISIQNEGIVSSSLETQKQLQAWPLGQARLEAPAVWDDLSSHFYAPITSGGLTSKVVMWHSGPVPAGSTPLADRDKCFDVPFSVFSLHPLSCGSSAKKKKGKKLLPGANVENSDGGVLVLGKTGAMSIIRPGVQETVVVAGQLEESKWQTVRAVAVAPIVCPPAASGHHGPSTWYLAVVSELRSQGSTGKQTPVKQKQEQGAGAGAGSSYKLRLFKVTPGGQNAIDGKVSGAGTSVNLVGSSTLGLGKEEREQAVQMVVSVSCDSMGAVTILWSGGQWQVLRLPSPGMGSLTPTACPGELVVAFSRNLATFQLTSATPDRPGKQPKKRQATPLRGAEEKLSDGIPAAALVAVPGTPYVAVAGYRLSQERGAAGGGTGIAVAVLDTQFGCVQGIQDVSDGQVTEAGESAGLLEGLGKGVRDTKLLGLRASWCGDEDGSLVLSCPDKIYVVELELAPLSLASLLGALSPQVMTSTGKTATPANIGGEDLVGGWGGLAVESAVAAATVLTQQSLAQLRTPPQHSLSQPTFAEQESKQLDIEQQGREGAALLGPLLGRREKYPWAEEAEQERQRLETLQMETVRSLEEGIESASEDDVRNLVVSFLQKQQPSSRQMLDRATSQMPVGSPGEDGGGEQERKMKKDDTGKAAKGKSMALLFQGLSPAVQAAVARYCLKHHLWGLLSHIVETGQLAACSCPGIVRELLQAQQLAIAERCVMHVQDLAPLDLLAVVRHVLLAGDDVAAVNGIAQTQRHLAVKAVEEVEARVGQGRKHAKPTLTGGKRAFGGKQKAMRLALQAVAAVVGFSDAEICLHTLVASLQDEMVLMAVLEHMDDREVSQLLHYLSKWIAKYCGPAGALAASKLRASFPIPQLAQVLMWTCTLLDCHLAKIVLLKECQEEIVSMQQLLSQQVVLTATLAPLLGSLSHIKAKAPLPGDQRESQGRKGYVVELLDI